MKKEIVQITTAMKKLKMVRAVYLFGSTVTGNTGPLSDIDIAVLLDKNVTRKECSNLKLKLIAEFTDIFKSDKIDLVILNDAPVQLTFEIISKGRIIFGKHEEIAEFEAKASSYYHDMKFYIDRYTEEIIKRTAERGFG
jgi:hypothetical protein